MSNLKLFVWEGVLVECSDGIMFALAETEGEARKLILATRAADLGQMLEDLRKPAVVYTTPVGFARWGPG